MVGRQFRQHGAHARRPGKRPVAAAPGEHRGAQSDTATGSRVLVGVGGAGHDEDPLEARVDVGAAECVDGGPEPTGMAGVEVGDLQDAGPHGVTPRGLLFGWRRPVGGR